MINTRYKFTLLEKLKGPKAKKREKETNVNKTSEDSSSSTAGKSNIKNMFLKMGKDSGKGNKRNRDTGRKSFKFFNIYQSFFHTTSTMKLYFSSSSFGRCYKWHRSRSSP